MQLSEETSKQQSGYGQPITLEVVDDIAIVTMKRGDNRFNFDFIRTFDEVLDKVEQNSSIRAMITTSEGKFYSNGLDLDWFGYLTNTGQTDKIFEYLRDYHSPFHWRLLTFPVPTIAAINGHCYAAGAFLAMCHDYQIMRTKRGWYCLNEVHNGLRLGAPMFAIVRNKAPYGTAFNELVVLGLRFTGEEAASKGIVYKACDMEQLMTEAINLAKSVTRTPYNRDSLRTMKQDLYVSYDEAVKSEISHGDSDEERAAKYKKAAKL